jgi:peptide-N4-(N-acetyl-beta-glucosaminyl)asparagine amidase
MEVSNEINNTLVDKEIVEKIQLQIYNGRKQLLEKCYNKITRDKKRFWECKQYPFIGQVLQLSRLIQPLTDDEKNAAIDMVLESPVYDRVKEEEIKHPVKFDHIDELVKALLKWFKEDFFKWVNKLDCYHCGNMNQDSITRLSSIRPYKKEHFDGKASVIERYQCLKCSKINEFPRYNDICTLLKTRMGRCGEWNNCFIAILRSLDVDIRYIWNAEDHVWCEYYSYKQKKWIHLDACENSYDQPMLYNAGWGKKMSYVFAIGKDYIVDVTRKYVDINKPELQLPRDKVPEIYLQTMLTYNNTSKLLVLSQKEILNVTSQLIADANTTRTNIFEIKQKKTQNSSKEDDHMLLPRQSGGAEWTKDRGEAGK